MGRVKIALFIAALLVVSGATSVVVISMLNSPDVYAEGNAASVRLP